MNETRDVFSLKETRGKRWVQARFATFFENF
jgi:hypothetical protein